MVKAHSAPWLTRTAAAAAVSLVAMGLIELTGWFTHAPVLMQVLPSVQPTARDAGLCLLLCGLILLMATFGSPRWLIVVGAATVSGLSLFTLVEFAGVANTAVDEFLRRSNNRVRVSSPTRMSPLGALCFALSALALLTAPRRGPTRSARWLALSGSMVAAVGIATSMGTRSGQAMPLTAGTSRAKRCVQRWA